MSRHRPGTTTHGRAGILATMGRGRALLGVPIALAVAAALAAAAAGGPLSSGPGAATTRIAAFSAQASQVRLTRASQASQSGLSRASQPTSALPAAPLVSGSWRLLPRTPVTMAPDQAVTVWTGKKMIIYGIRHTVSGTFFQRFNIAYLPRASAWQRLPSGPRPVNNGEGGNVAVWTRSEMLVLGPTAGAYKPATSTWRRVSRKGPGATDGAVIGWTGHQVLVWGGVCCNPSNSGRAYRVATNTWTAMPAAPLAPRAFPAGAWTGKELVVAGGTVRTAGGAVKGSRSGAAYNPATRTWRRLPLMPRGRYSAQAVWDGREVLLLGGFRAPGTAPAGRGMAYNPATNTWRLVRAMPFARDGFAAVWTGRHVLVWGGVSGRNGTSLPPHGEAYNPATNTWTALPAAPLHGRADPIAVWTGHQMIVWGGDFGSTAYTNGAAFTPRRP
jgi:hypothetical protein